MKVIIAAGGTGGHITPGIAIGTMLQKQGHDILFVGTEKGMEVDLVPKAGFELRYIHVAGLKGGILSQAKALVLLQKGITECRKLIQEEKPDLVIGTGGYVTAPLMMAGIQMKVPTMIHESNALPGKTTKWLAKHVDCVAVGFEAAKERLENGKNVVWTGNPSKMGMMIQSKEEAKAKIGVPGKLLLVFGGSQGAQKINEVMVSLLQKNAFPHMTVIYATGPKHYDAIKEQLPNLPTNVRLEKYIYNMEEVMRASDLVVCRSGALTVSEIAIVGIPSVLIPFPYAAENHQYYNAKALEDVGAGVMIEEKDLTAEVLENTVTNLMAKEETLQQMAQAATKIGDNKALERVEEAIRKIIK